MIISDLNYLEVVSESSIIGGGSKKKKSGLLFLFPVKTTAQTNVAVVTQTANASSASIVTGKGDAISEANAVNVSTIEQANVNS
jgi:hypothetical protein